MATPDEGELSEKQLADQLQNRIARADLYLKGHLKEGSEFQQSWYSKKASKYKSWSQRLSFIVILSGVLITLAQVFNEKVSALGWPLAIPVLTAMLGAVVTLAKGLERIGKFEETWLGYRKASEQMKREYRLYINSAGDYSMDDEDTSYRRFVENTEAIIAEEQQIYWRTRAGSAHEEPDAKKLR